MALSLAPTALSAARFRVHNARAPRRTIVPSASVARSCRARRSKPLTVQSSSAGGELTPEEAARREQQARPNDNAAMQGEGVTEGDGGGQSTDANAASIEEVQGVQAEQQEGQDYSKNFWWNRLFVFIG